MPLFPNVRFKRYSFFIMSACLLAACGGNDDNDKISGGTGDGSIENPPAAIFKLTGSTPADGATNVDRSIAPQLQFSSSLNSATATATNIKLEYAGGAATFDVAVTGPQLTVTPSQKLLPNTAYTLRVGTGLANTNGGKLVMERTVSFTTADRQWSTTRLIGANAGDASNAQLAFDADGNALAVWEQRDGLTISIYANRYTAGSGWGAAELIGPNTGSASNAQIAFDADGNAWAVWQQATGGLDIYANRYTAGSGWGTAVLIDADPGYATDPQIVIDASGNAMVVWMQTDGTRYNIWSKRYTAGSGWGTVEQVETDAGGAGRPQIAIDAGGNVLAVWEQSDGTRNNIWANRYTPGSGWDAAQVIETDSGDAIFAQIAVDSGGNAIAVWQQYDGTRYNIWANRYISGGSWGTAQLLETNNAGSAQYPQIAFDTAGNALAVWKQSDGTRYNVWASRYTAGGSWDTAQLIETDNAGDADFPQIAFDAAGNAMAVWEQSDGTHNIWANRYIPGNGWSTARLIEAGSGNAARPQIAFDSAGDAMAVWQQFDGVRDNILSNRFE